MFNPSKTNWTFNLTAAIESQNFPVAKNEKKCGGFQARFRDIGLQRNLHIFTGNRRFHPSKALYTFAN